MKTLKNTTNLVAGSILVSFVLVAFSPIYAGELEMTDEQNAKVSRFKARERVERNRNFKDLFADEDSDDDAPGLEEDKCGVVDIGNVTQDRPFGPPQQIDIIITGDVINTGNNCN